MILVIRISGQVQIPYDVVETLYRMRLRRKYIGTLLADTVENRKLLLKVRNYVAYGKISDAMLEKLLETRGVAKTKKTFDVKKMVATLHTKGMEEAGLKPFFRLHPPRKGIDSKKHIGVAKGVLGDHKDAIDKLVERML